MNKNVIPKNEKGKQIDLSEEVIHETTENARKCYNEARHKLLHPVIWKPMTGPLAAEFKEDKETRSEPGQRVKEGDFIRINLPAPGLSAGDGHDWVQVDSIIENADTDADESLALTVKVSPNPEQPEKGVAHFFAAGATSTFTISRKDCLVKATYHGRNESPNLENPSLTDKVRNAVVAIGAIAGISELQWKAFLKGLLNY